MVESSDQNDNTRTHVVLTKGTMVSHYRIVEKIGAGGMGEVYLAEDTELKRQVALKFLPLHLVSDEDLKARFKREAQAAAALEHPNIVTVYEVSEHQGRPYIVMQYLERQSLREVIEVKTLSLKKIIDLAIQICEGLSKAHQAGIIHRDIKPSNIVIDADGRPKILDFGLAVIRGGEHLTKTGSTLGTVRYMSPEQAQGENIDHRSDLFSLGVVLYELITGQSPFARENDVATVQAIMSATPEPLAKYRANVPDELQRIVSKLLEKDPAYRYQTAAGVASDLKQERRRLDSGKSSIVSSVSLRPSPKRKLTKILIPTSALALIVLLLLVLKPWKFEVKPSEEAIAAENRLAIMYFDNLADPEDSQRLGEIATNLLITDLTESQYLDVVSSQRLYDILKLLGKEGTKVLDREVATQVAEKARAKRMLLGSILQVEPQIIITSRLVDVQSGRAIASQRITGETGDNIFTVVDRLTVEVKNDMSLPAQARNEPDRPVADVTTHSPEAYRYYLEGLDYDLKIYWQEAQERYRKALEFDSTFAMAYYRLASTEVWFKGRRQAKELMAKAVEYSDKVSHKEKGYIRYLQVYVAGDYAQAITELEKIVERYPDEKEAFLLMGHAYYRGLREFKEAIRQCRRAIEIDPLYKLAYNGLAYLYNDVGDYEKSIWAINQYISIAPDEANPYDSRADLYAFNGKIDQAIKSYKKALEIKPDFFGSRAKLGHIHLFKKQYAKAESCYQQLSSSSEKDTRSEGRTYLALISLYQGKLEEALKVLDDGIAADRMEQAEGKPNADKHFLKACIYREKKNLNLALTEAETCLKILEKADPDDPLNSRNFYAQMLAENAEIAKAEEVARALKKDVEKTDPHVIYVYWLAMATIEQSKGNTITAVTYLEEAARVALPPHDLRVLTSYMELFQVQFLLADAYLKSGRQGEAVAVLEKALSSYDETRAGAPLSAVKAYYLLGLAYEKSGWTNKAIEQYEIFLDIWKDADPDIEEVEDAKERLERLKSES